MAKVTRSFQTSIMLRVGSTEKIIADYNNKLITFSCAANWFDYAYKKGNSTIGDMYECIFAHIEGDDPRASTLADSCGNPMGNHLSILQKPDGTKLLRCEPTILMPALCFYSIDVETICTRLEAEAHHAVNSFELDLDMYLDAVGYKAGESAYLIIIDKDAFFHELTQQIPAAIRDNEYNLTSERFYAVFDDSEPLTANYVNYEKFTEDELFFESNSNANELFWKLPKFEQQSELRVVIPNINFVQMYGKGCKYDHTKNQLTVNLPNLHKYALVLPADQIRYLGFYEYDKATKTCKFAIWGGDHRV